MSHHQNLLECPMRDNPNQMKYGYIVQRYRYDQAKYNKLCKMAHPSASRILGDFECLHLIPLIRCPDQVRPRHQKVAGRTDQVQEGLPRKKGQGGESTEELR